MVRGLRSTARLFGREVELEAIARALAEYRLVTLWGPPGVGKTRLALEHIERAATSESESLPYEFLDLTAARSPAEASAALAQALGFELESETGPVEQIGRLLAERGPMAIVLDNFEQAVDAVSHTVERWLELAPEVSLLVTSRERLGIAGEHVIEIGALSESEAIQLFADRARLADPGFSLTPEVEASLEKLVARLDRLPLAIELCACRAGIFSPSELQRELSKGLELLSPPARASFGKLRGLGEAIGSSWSALSPAERSLLTQCSTFVGPFTLAAASAVVELEGDESPPIFDVLQRLVDRSLVASIEAEEKRFQILHYVAEFARARLMESPGAAAAFRRHAQHFLEKGREWSERVVALQDLDARRELERARDELGAIYQRALAGEADLSRKLAIDAALALVPWYRRFGPYSTLVEMLDTVLAIAPAEIDPILRCKLMGARGSALRVLGRLEESRVELGRAVEIAEQGGRAGLAALLESERAQVELELGEHAAARARQERVLEVYRENHLRVLEGHAQLLLGNMNYYVDALEDAQRCYERALAVHREVGDRIFECEALRGLALVELELGRRGSAREHFEQALAQIERVDERRWRPATLAYFGILEQEEDNPRRAAALYSEAISEARWVGSWKLEGLSRGYLGTCLLEQGALGEARAALLRAVDDLGAFERVPPRAVFRACIAVIDAMRDDVEAAERELELAKSELDRMPEQVFLRQAVEIHAGHLELARARAESRTESSAGFSALARARLGRAEFEQSDIRFARRLLERALAGSIRPDPRAAWKIQATGLWFEPPYGARIDLGRKHALRRLLVRLAEQRVQAEQAPLTSSELINAGWPGERIQKHAARNRLRVALHTLRRLGLGELLLTHADGYYLDPSSELELVSAGKES